ncbi:MAG: hypothetical protein H6810_02540 [Phycisphaeraceae bacterium]|nr:MAG: hypothetical protein H6810_02540 [Phycisphaeraceae bacterium]
MGLFEALARLFGVSKTPREQAKYAAGNGRAAVERPAMPLPEQPVAVDIYTEDDDVISDAEMAQDDGTSEQLAGHAPLAAPKNRQELLTELRKNYTEVLGLVRKVDTHLDEQSRRSERLLELAEQSARRMDVLPELAEQNRRVADALTDLVDLTRDARTRNDLAMDRLTKNAVQQLETAQRQTSALQNVQAALHRSSEASAEMAQSMSGFGETLGEMAGSTRDLGATIAAMRETDAEREAELAKLVANSQKWLVAAVVFSGLIAVGALALVLNSVL